MADRNNMSPSSVPTNTYLHITHISFCNLQDFDFLIVHSPTGIVYRLALIFYSFFLHTKTTKPSTMSIPTWSSPMRYACVLKTFQVVETLYGPFFTALENVMQLLFHYNKPKISVLHFVPSGFSPHTLFFSHGRFISLIRCSLLDDVCKKS